VTKPVAVIVGGAVGAGGIAGATLGPAAISALMANPTVAGSLAALNAIDDGVTVAQCLSGNQNACATVQAIILNPIPGAGLADDVADLAKLGKANNNVVKVTADMANSDGRVVNIDQAYMQATVEDMLRDKLNLLKQNNPTLKVNILSPEDFSKLRNKETVTGFFDPNTKSINLDETHIIAAANHEMIHAEHYFSGLITRRYLNVYIKNGDFNTEKGASTVSHALEEMKTIMDDINYKQNNELMLNNLDVHSFVQDDINYFGYNLGKFGSVSGPNLDITQKSYLEDMNNQLLDDLRSVLRLNK